LGETITGVWLFEELTKRAEEKNWKVFILGGWNDVDVRVVEKLKQLYPKLRVVSDAGEKKVGTSESENTRVVEKINKFKPDILFVAYNPVKQEKWIAKNKKSLKVGVAIGIGGTLNEFVGDLKPTPLWMQQAGLKWLWRLILEPFRWKRMINAVIVFPWMVFRESWKN
jgi:N-acetylglucosaminyldiphosphoundecaprenol N-acetyl-beta-D-mannosaminyltransferase